MCTDKLDDIVHKHNNTYHKTTKIKSVDIKPSTYINFKEENNKEGPKFKAGNNVRISKYKNIFAKGYTPNLSEKFFVIKNIKNTVLRIHVISDLNGEEIAGTFHEKDLQKTNQKEFRVQKVIKRKDNKLYVKSKGYGRYFNSWIDKKDKM